jgi:hypothetical protein
MLAALRESKNWSWETAAGVQAAQEFRESTRPAAWPLVGGRQCGAARGGGGCADWYRVLSSPAQSGGLRLLNPAATTALSLFNM